MRTKIILTFIVVLAIILAGSFFFVKGGLGSLRGADTAPWYAVHLSNGQVYFGHLSRVSPNTITMDDTRYLETYQAGDNSVSQSENFAVQQAPKQIYSLVRRGDEKSLATDHTLYINRASVLFWEKLSADSDIVNSIKAVAGQKAENSK
ncbi:MAG: hypothetical protein AAB497_03330 [Patescibacteria group bacterium]